MDAEDILVVIAYRDDSMAQAARERLGVLGQSDDLTLDVAAMLTKDTDGQVKVEHAHSHRGRRLLRRRRDTTTIDDQITQEAGEALEPGQAALCLLVQEVTPEQIVPELSKYGGTVIKTSLPPEREQILKDAIAQQMSGEEITAVLRSNAQE